MSKRLEWLSKERVVDINAQARQMLWDICPPTIFDNRKSWLARVARYVGFGQRRTRAIFYCEARVITAHEWRVLNERLDALKKQQKQAGELNDQLGAAYRNARDGLPMALQQIDGAGSDPTASGDQGCQPRRGS